jgi:hypothetical protein
MATEGLEIKKSVGNSQTLPAKTSFLLVEQTQQPLNLI